MTFTEISVVDAEISNAAPPTATTAREGVQGETDETFANPIVPGADPWVILHDGFYYWCASDKQRGVAVYRSERLSERGEEVMVWQPPERGPHSQQVWAPELHRLDGRWYIYVAASSGRNQTHRMIVLESVGEDPTSEFRFKAELYTGDDVATGRRNRWAIDGTILEHGGSRYMLWSGWADHRDEQWLYIATMSNPWTISSNRVRLCANDDFLWERVDETPASRGLNEAPQVLLRNGRVFVVYSASASWQPSYKLGLLELADGGDPMDPRAWLKHREAVMESTEATWGVGHCGFTQSPDGTEDWIVFHAKLDRKPNWNRAVHIQQFSWGQTGRPIFGEPTAAGVRLARPSGETMTVSTQSVGFGRAALAAAIGDQPMVQDVKVLEVNAPLPEPASAEPAQVVASRTPN
jgi:GH43 family beta-xylosidase